MLEVGVAPPQTQGRCLLLGGFSHPRPLVFPEFSMSRLIARCNDLVALRKALSQAQPLVAVFWWGRLRRAHTLPSKAPSHSSSEFAKCSSEAINTCQRVSPPFPKQVHS